MGLFSRRSTNIFEDDEFLRHEVDAGSGHTADYGDVVMDSPEQQSSSKPEYGIQETIKLLRAMPKGDQDIVLMVVKKTLESMDVRVADIIRDAEIKEKGFNQLLSTLRAEVTDYQSKVKTKQQEIITLEVVLKETTAVKNRLMYVENLSAEKAKIPMMEDSSVSNVEVLDKEEDLEVSNLQIKEAEHNDREIEVEDLKTSENAVEQVQKDTSIEDNDSPKVEAYAEIDFDLDDKSVAQVLKEAINKSRSAIKSKAKLKRKSQKKTTA